MPIVRTWVHPGLGPFPVLVVGANHLVAGSNPVPHQVYRHHPPYSPNGSRAHLFSLPRPIRALLAPMSCSCTGNRTIWANSGRTVHSAHSPWSRPRSDPVSSDPTHLTQTDLTKAGLGKMWAMQHINTLLLKALAPLGVDGWQSKTAPGGRVQAGTAPGWGGTMPTPIHLPP